MAYGMVDYERAVAKKKKEAQSELPFFAFQPQVVVGQNIYSYRIIKSPPKWMKEKYMFKNISISLVFHAGRFLDMLTSNPKK